MGSNSRKGASIRPNFSRLYREGRHPMAHAIQYSANHTHSVLESPIGKWSVRVATGSVASQSIVYFSGRVSLGIMEGFGIVDLPSGVDDAFPPANGVSIATIGSSAFHCINFFGAGTHKPGGLEYLISRIHHLLPILLRISSISRFISSGYLPLKACRCTAAAFIPIRF